MTKQIELRVCNDSRAETLRYRGPLCSSLSSSPTDTHNTGRELEKLAGEKTDPRLYDIAS